MNERISEISRSSRRNRLSAAILATAVVAGGLVFLSVHTADNRETAHALPFATAMVATVTSAAEVCWPVALQAMGPTAPWQEASIGAQVAGLRLAEIKADVGDRVRRGQLLVVEYAVLGIRERALSMQEALLDACYQRARAIVMTTIAMVAGMVPISLGLGADASFRRLMAVAVIGGLVTSTALSLLAVPVAFTYVAGMEHRVRGWFGRKGNQQTFVPRSP